MHGNQIDNEYVTTPGRNLEEFFFVDEYVAGFYEGFFYHVEIGQGCATRPEYTTGFYRANPEEIGEHEGKDGDT